MLFSVVIKQKKQINRIESNENSHVQMELTGWLIQNEEFETEISNGRHTKSLE